MKNTLIKAFVLLFALGALLVVPFNKDLVFGYGSTLGATCSDPSAGGAPTLLSAKASGTNQVELNWSKAADPVTHYVISYGLTPSKPLYGNPNVGGKETTSYTVGSLSGGTTYYFRVRAGNGCNGGAYSNEIAASAGGRTIAGPAAGFIPGVLGVSIVASPSPSASPIISPNPTGEPTSEPSPTPAGQGGNGGFFNRLLNFFRHLFGG